ncbi:MAG: HDIG domain-containing protein [Ruminococcaceae bacterium]|nr:HDIG domain-containing protein [Oscillospiraceae bacterium]
MKKSRKLQLNNMIYRLITAVSLVLIVIVVLFFNKPEQIDVAVGDIAPKTIYSNKEFPDTKATEQKRQEARDAVPNQYIPDTAVNDKVAANIDDLFMVAATYRSDVSPLSNVMLINAAKLKISEETAAELINASDAQFKEMKKVSDILKNEMSNGVSKLADSQQKCDAEIDKLNLTDKQKSAAKSIASLVLTENMIFDEEKTKAEKDKAAAAVEEIVIKKNAEIIRKGEEITPEVYDRLHQLGLLKGTNQVSGTYIFGMILMMLVGYAIISFYFAKNRKKNPASIPIIASCSLLVILIAFYGSKIVPEDMIALLPAGLFPGIATIFSCAQAAITTNFVLAVLCAIAFNANWGYAVCLIIAGTMSAYCFSAVKRRSHLLPASIVSSVFYGLAFCSLSLIESTSAITAFLAFIKGFGGGFLSGLITIGSLPLVEWLFNATTPMKLSELANPENKLLKKLLVEAPGTYHHSLTVANISEIAARSIHADSLLTRVGAYYHDIGKLRYPHYFKENQYGENPHNALAPDESSEIIISHVTEGVEIATKNRLPQQIIDLIAQHHGTTTTGYFLIRAREIDPDVDEANFTYPGPAPQTKEAAIVMLADSCEAAVRSIEDKTEAKIESMVRRIATDRVNSGQFSHCNMTFEELETVIKVITKTLGGYFHERIKYE